MAAVKALGGSADVGEHVAGEPIQAVLAHTPGNGAPFGGVEVTTKSGWFAVRPSGTEDVYKVYAESFRGRDHLQDVQRDAERIVAEALTTTGARQSASPG